jgi:nucleotide-binding universal stress UspA family protein
MIEETSVSSILFPYDFSEVSDYALKHAVINAKRFGYHIKLLNILDSRTRAYMKLNHLKEEGLKGVLSEMCEKIMKETPGLKAEYHFRPGSIKTMCKLATELGVRYMVLGIDEPKSNATEILEVTAISPVPVFVVQQGATLSEFKHLLFPIDDFHATLQKVGWTKRIAKKSGAKVSIFSINQTNAEKLYKHKKIIRQVEEFFDKFNVKTETHFAKGKISEFPDEALAFGLENKCDCFIIMHRPKKRFSSVATIDKKLMFNDGKIPVLCVNIRDVGVAAGFN